jgi:hypothetical protein
MEKWKVPAFVFITVIILFIVARWALVETHRQNELAADHEVAQPESVKDAPTQKIDPNIKEMSAETAPMNTGGSREERIKSGAKFGFIKSIDTNSQGVTSIVFDEARFLTGDEADKAAKADNGCNKPNP